MNPLRTTTLSVLENDCWNRIGISGDRSCPELQAHIHCRNCPVYESAAKAFFDRPAPEGYLEEWVLDLAGPCHESDTKHLSVLIFRLHREWLALATKAVVEVTTTRPVHVIPHRSNEVLVGMVNLRGKLELMVSLPALLGIEPSETKNEGNDPPAVNCGARLVVIRRDASTWVFEADEVPGVRRFPQDVLKNVPSTLANPESSFSKSIIHWHDRSVGYLDENRLFSALGGRGAGR
jgi:chemotaxis-related protein WspD